MFTLKSTQFNLEGFIMVLLASFIGGIRWTLTQLLMQKAELGESDSWDMGTKHMAIWVIVTLWLKKNSILKSKEKL